MSEKLSPKVYVAVKADFNEDGIMLPREITWEDGTRFEIDRVLDIRGGNGNHLWIDLYDPRCHRCGPGGHTLSLSLPE